MAWISSGNLDIDDDIIDLTLDLYGEPHDFNVIAEFDTVEREFVQLNVSMYSENGEPLLINNMLERDDARKIEGIIFDRWFRGDYI